MEHILTTKGTMPKPEAISGASIPEYIEIKATDGSTVAFLSPEADGIKDCWIDDEQNGSCILEFELPLNSPKWQYLTDQYRIYAGDKEFVILNPDAVDKQRDGKKLTGKIKAHESWVKLGKKYQTISNDPQNPSPPWGAVIIVSGGSDLSGGRYPVGSAGHTLYALLQGTGWTVGTVDVTGTYDLETEKESVLYNINQVQEKWGGILVWDSVNKTVSLRDEEAYQPYTGYQIRYAKNLKGISRADDYDIVTRLYPFGENDLNIANVNGGLLYLDNQSYSTEVLEGVWYNQDLADQTQLKTQAEKQLAVMCRPRHNYKTEVLDLRSLPGYGHETFKRSDMVDLFDEDFGADARVRIIRYRHNVFQPWLCDMELGDPLEKIAASVAQTVLMAKFYKNVVKPNESFQNLLKAIINTAATEINGASGDYNLVDGVSTWFDRDEVTGELTGKLLRITPQGLIISYDGGQTWKLAISGEGFHANAGWVGKLNAGVVTVGAGTTFEAGYDPTKGSMGVDADCVGLWHFDGSLNSHKGVAAIADENFEAGCFGQAVKVEEGTTNVILDPSFENADISTSWNNANGPTWTYTSKTVRTRDVTYKKYGSASAKCGDGANNGTYGVAEINQGTSAHAVTAGQKWTLSFSAYVTDVEQIIPLIRFYDASGNDVSGTITPPSGWSYYAYYKALYPAGTPVSPPANVWTDYSFSIVVPSGVAFAAISLQYHAEGNVKYVWFDGVQLEKKDHATPFVDGTRLGGLKVPTTGMSASAGTITFRAYDLASATKNSVILYLLKAGNDSYAIKIEVDGTAPNYIRIRYSGDSGWGSFLATVDRTTLTSWDAISVAWTSSTISLSVNNQEVLYRDDINFTLSGLGDYFFIGTDHNGNNAINTLVDELRVDKVYRDTATRIAWHKAGVPFYTSEDMKQWPGYIRAETDGLKVYDSENALRVLVGSWLKDAIRKYGIKIIDGEIYSTYIRTGREGDTRYIAFEPPNSLCVYAPKTNGSTESIKVLQLRSPSIANESGLEFYNANGDGLALIESVSNAPRLILECYEGGVHLKGYTGVYCSGDFQMMSGTKYNVEQTENYGQIGLAVRESPEQRYVDEGMGTLIGGECRIDIDPVFLECIEPHTPDSRWYIQLTAYADVDLYVAEIGDNYFVVKERNGGTTTGAEFTWSLSATRKDYAMIRFMEVLD